MRQFWNAFERLIPSTRINSPST